MLNQGCQKAKNICINPAMTGPMALKLGAIKFGDSGYDTDESFVSGWLVFCAGVTMTVILAAIACRYSGMRLRNVATRAPMPSVD